MTDRILITPNVDAETATIDGFDLLLDFWIDAVLKYEEQIDADILHKALEQCINRWTLFACRKITDPKGQVYISEPSGLLYETERSEEPYPLTSNMLVTQANPYLTDRAAYRYDHKTSLSSPNIPLLQLRLTSCPNGSVLGVSIWHPIADTVALFSFLEDLVGTYKEISGQPLNNRAAIASSNTDSPLLNKKLASDGPVIPTQEQIDKELVPRPSEFSNGFGKNFDYLDFSLSDHTISQLNDVAQSIGCHWSDVLIAKAWQSLPTSICELGEEQTLHIINSTQNIIKGQKVGNNLVVPCLSLPNKDWSTITFEDLAKKIRHTVNFKTLTTIRESATTRKWLSAYIHGHNHNAFTMKLFVDSIFGTGVIYNNFSFLETVDLSFNESRPRLAEFSVDPGPRVFSIFPFSSDENNWSFQVGLFEDDLIIFQEKFLTLLNQL